MNKSRYRYIERVLYDYPENKKKQEVYSNELEYLTQHGDVKVQTYEEGTIGGEVSDRVLDYVHRKQELEKWLRRITREVNAVEKVMRRLIHEDTDHTTKLCIVLFGVYFAGNNKGIGLLGVDEEEVPALKHEIVKLVSSSIKVK